jgi:hypothetical protein
LPHLITEFGVSGLFFGANNFFAVVMAAAFAYPVLLFFCMAVGAFSEVDILA